MKRSPIKRKTPLLRKRKHIPRMSKNKKEWEKLYRFAHEQDDDYQHCANCGLLGNKYFLDKHHPFGRRGKWILEYVYVCGPFLHGLSLGCNKHTWIHDNGKKARAEGWLTEVYDGKPYDETKVRPWKYLPDKKGLP